MRRNNVRFLSGTATCMFNRASSSTVVNTVSVPNLFQYSIGASTFLLLRSGFKWNVRTSHNLELVWYVPVPYTPVLQTIDNIYLLVDVKHLRILNFWQKQSLPRMKWTNIPMSVCLCHFTSVERQLEQSIEWTRYIPTARSLSSCCFTLMLLHMRSCCSVWRMQLICRCNTVPSCANHARFHTVF